MTEVNWRGDEIVALLEDITEEGLLKAAYLIEAEAKLNAAVDTGFMQNTIYVHGPKDSTFQARSETLQSNKTGATAQHETVGNPPPVEDGTVIVGVAANYAIYVEMDQPFLYPAFSHVVRQIEGLIQSAARGRL